MPWHALSPDELALLEAAFWAGGIARHALSDTLQFSRSKTNSLAAGLLDQGLLDEAGVQHSTGGRRPETLRVHGRIGVLVGVDIGATSLDVALLRPDLSVIARHSQEADVEAGPGPIMARLRSLLPAMLAENGIARDRVLAVGIGVPGPVNFAAGQLVNPPLMPGWDSYAIRDDLREITEAPVFVDNDVNLMALGVLWSQRRQIENFLVIKVGTGIGCGIVCHGELYRGASGSAGDVGHICVDPEGALCRCGNRGCVEAMAAAPAIVAMGREAAESGRSVALAQHIAETGRLEASDIGAACRAGDAEADAIVRRSGRLIGQVLAALVNFYNPSHIFIGGGVSQIGPMFLAAIRQSVNQRSLALSTRHLEITSAPMGPETGLIGAGVLAMREAMRGQTLPRRTLRSQISISGGLR
ncbi:ROK family protein [Bosea sp. 124]|uniref:ROK family protein n=1 Tax=Bosea sp. 124 TaxID=2135642 RepID=UPI000D3CB7C5|nr:ROK family protein [Bosea sp. 124]PTM39495.1 glucokinase-like ROK family protein [Bosea sp. 124]